MDTKKLRTKIDAILEGDVHRPMDWVKPEHKLIQPGNEPDANASAAATAKLKEILGQRGDQVAIETITRELNAVTTKEDMVAVVKMLYGHFFRVHKNANDTLEALATGLEEALSTARLNPAWQGVVRRIAHQAKTPPSPKFTGDNLV